MVIDVQVEFKGELPFRLPIPDDDLFPPTGDSSVKEIAFEEFEVPRSADQGQGVNIDDGVGNFMRSRIYVRFITSTNYDETDDRIDARDLHIKIISSVNNFIDACKYVSRDPKLTNVWGFPGESV